MRCVYCLQEITWSEWLFKGHMNARCEIKQNEITKLKVQDRSIASHAHEIWSNEVEPEENLLGNAIRACYDLDEENGLLRGYSDGLD